jgi:hypothetical protein
MIHNRPIYHCQCCGRVVTQERYQLPPCCCHKEMVRAGEETLDDDFTPTQDTDLVRNGRESDRFGSIYRERKLSGVN